MMTKKDFERAAEIVGAHRKGNPVAATCIQEAFIALFRGDNPRFDADRFRKVCNVTGVIVEVSGKSKKDAQEVAEHLSRSGFYCRLATAP